MFFGMRSMANNYRQFSEELNLKTPEEVEWAKKRLSELRRSVDRIAAVEVLEGDEAEDLHRSESKADFEFSFDTNSVVMFAEENGSVDDIASFVEEYLRTFDPTGCWSLTWADHCSKPRPGEFGGGAAFITASGTKWIDSGGWASVRRRAWNTCKSCQRDRKDHTSDGKCLFEPTVFVKSEPEV